MTVSFEFEVTPSRVRANGIDHNVLRWRPTDASSQPSDVLVLCHGFLDVAWSYRWVAERLAGRGHHVIAFDWRGHGDSSWIGDGGFYHFPDYVLDLHLLLPKLVHPSARTHLVGHSMGGTACTMYCGTEPNAISTLTLIEGIGPLAHPANLAPARFEGFLRTTESFADVEPKNRTAGKPMASLDNVLSRLRVQNPHLSDEQGRWLASKTARQTPEGWVWKFDPLHRARSPFPFLQEMFAGFLARVEAPVLYLCSDNGFRPPDEAERLKLLRQAKQREFSGFGHNLHWFAADQVAAEIHAHVTNA